MTQELGVLNIRVNGLVSGAIRMDRQDKMWADDAEGFAKANQAFLNIQVLKFRLDASACARLVLFVALDESKGCIAQDFIVV